MAIYILFGVAGAIWAGAVANSKNNNPLLHGLVGFLFPLVGVLCAYVAAPTTKPAEYEPFQSRRA